MFQTNTLCGRWGRTALALAVIASLSLELAGCGGGGSSSSATDSTPSTTPGSSSYTADIKAVAIVLTALEVTTTVTDMGLIDAGATPCTSGSVTVDPVSYAVTYTGCVTALSPGASLSGTETNAGLAGASSTYGILNTTNPSITLTLSTPYAATVALGTGNVVAPSSITGTPPLITSTLSTSSFAFDAGTGSHYLLTTYTLGSPTGYTKSVAGGHETTTVTSSAGSVSYNGTAYTVSGVGGAVVWTDQNFPTQGVIGIIDAANPTTLNFNVTFKADGTFVVSGLVGGVQVTSKTVAWSDASAQAALHDVTH